MTASVLVIACGAIARELVRIRQLNGWDHVEFQCLPASLHNTPDQIPTAVRAMIEQDQARFDKIFVAYADCGTGGLLDKMLKEYDIARIPGAHCYEFYSGSENFSRLADEEPGTFYLTDFLVRHFERLVVEGLGLDRQPQLMSMYFGNYKRVAYLAQTDSDELLDMARKQAEYLGLEFHHEVYGDQPLSLLLKPALDKEITWQK